MQDNQIIYDLVKETRDDVKKINEKLNNHILNTSTQLAEAKAPQTFLKTLSTCVIWLSVISSFVSSIVLFFLTPKP